MNERRISLEVATDLAWIYNEARDVTPEAADNFSAAERIANVGVVGVALEAGTLDLLEEKLAVAKNTEAYALACVPNFFKDVVLPAGGETVTIPEVSLENRISDFLNPEIKLDANEQLTTMVDFWNKLGVTIPTVSEEQMDSLQDAIEANPHKRLVPTPLSPRLLEARLQMTEKAREVFPEQQFVEDKDISALCTPDTDRAYGQALVDPEANINRDGNYAKLIYKIDDGNYVGRSEYLESLVASADTAEAEDGTTWVFPLMNVQVRSPRDRQRADEHFFKASHVETPESLIAMQLLHQANGTPNPKLEVDFANEALAKTNEEGELILDDNDNPILLRVASVSWGPGGRQVGLSGWGAGGVSGYFGRRGAESGL